MRIIKVNLSMTVLLLLAQLLMQGSMLANDLLGEDRVYLRFTNTRSDSALILVRLNIVPNHHEPFTWDGKTVYVGQNGANENDTDASWLPPGESTPWIDVGAYMSLRGTLSYETYLSPVLCGMLTQPASDGISVLIEVAEGRGVQVIRRIDIHEPSVPAVTQERVVPWNLGWRLQNEGPYLATVGLLIPTRPDIQPRVYTLEEMIKWQMDVIEDFPDVGRVPSQFNFRGRTQPEIAKALGYREHPGDDIVLVSLGDEIHIELETPEEEINRRFRSHLKNKGLKTRGLLDDANWKAAEKLPVSKQWDAITWEPIPERPKQFYESAMFRYNVWSEELRERTREAEERYPGKTVYSGANFSPHMNVWPDTRQWILPFRTKAMTMTWTEDWWWQLPECSPQVYGWLLTALRLGGSYHNLPMHYYIMPYQDNTPDNVQRQHGLALSQGAKIINHFVVDGQTFATWDYIDYIESPRTLQVLHDMIRDVGAVEHRLFPAQPEQARIAIMLSSASDTWDTEDIGGAGNLYGAEYNVNNEERKALWLALRHAQYPVDCILDEDIAEGGLKDIDVLFIVGSEMSRAAVSPLMEWVKKGGYVYATGGGGIYDEYRRPITEMLELYGLESRELDRGSRHIRPRRLPEMKPVDSIRFENSADASSNGLLKVPAFIYRETYEPALGSQVLARYVSTGEPAVIEHSYGRGKTVSSGALMGLAYMAPAIQPTSKVLPTNFPASIRDFISLLPRSASVTVPVTTSDPLIEAQYMVGPEGNIVILTNWHETPHDAIIVRFPGIPEVNRVRSLRGAGYFQGHLHEQDMGDLEISVVNGVPEVTLPLGIIDYLIID